MFSYLQKAVNEESKTIGQESESTSTKTTNKFNKTHKKEGKEEEKEEEKGVIPQGISFSVENVKVDYSSQLNTAPSTQNAITNEFQLVNPKFQASSTCARPLIQKDFNIKGAFYRAVHLAFTCHFPLILSPDIIWLIITQGLAVHINQNSEKLRSHFVSFQGKMEISVRRDEFVLDGVNNDWAGCISEFSADIEKHIGSETHKLIVADFSTTGPTERIASEIVLMDSMKAYFRYIIVTACGIPQITIEGTVDDWKKIYERVDSFNKFGLEEWTKGLKHILKHFISAAEGNPDISFWRSIYKYKGSKGSGSPYISGWMINLFPYLWEYRGKLVPNNSFPEEALKRYVGPEYPPASTSKCPIKWLYLAREIPMHFHAGFIGVSQDPASMALRPEIGWAVVLD